MITSNIQKKISLPKIYFTKKKKIKFFFLVIRDCDDMRRVFNWGRKKNNEQAPSISFDVRRSSSTETAALCEKPDFRKAEDNQGALSRETD